ncbi:RrF2 family transcriptional regulator [Planctomycetota bacterium]
MKLSTRVRYGLRAMVELAKQSDDMPISLRELAEKQQISPKYLEQMAASLKIAGLVESIRGAEGGYRLGRPADKITAWDIYQVLDIASTPTDCLNHHCNRENICSCRELWDDLNRSIVEILQSYTLQKLAKRELALQKKHGAGKSPGCRSNETVKI